MEAQKPIGGDINREYKRLEKKSKKLDSLAQGVTLTYLDKVYRSMLADQFALEELRLYLDLIEGQQKAGQKDKKWASSKVGLISEE